MVAVAQLVRDRKDQIVLPLALTAGVSASALVTGEADFLALKDQFNPLQLLTPFEFYAVLHP